MALDPAVGSFLSSLKKKGLKDDQIRALSQKQRMPEAWNLDLQNYLKKNASDKNKSGPAKQPATPPMSAAAKQQAQGAANAFGGAVGRRVRRGDPNYKSTNATGDIFSKNNPHSAPNRVANVAGDIGHAITYPFRHRPDNGAVSRRRKKYTQS